MSVFNKKKPHIIFREIIRYCKLMHYDINDILEMSDTELRIWYKRTLEMVDNPMEFRIRTGMNLDNAGKKHPVVSIVDGRVIKK